MVLLASVLDILSVKIVVKHKVISTFTSTVVYLVSSEADDSSPLLKSMYGDRTKIQLLSSKLLTALTIYLIMFLLRA